VCQTAEVTTSTPPRTAEAHTARSRRTRVALVAAVRAELRATATFTAEAVAERAGCSPATFYSHFGTKDDALTAAFDQTLTELVDMSTDALTTEAFVAHGVDATLETFVADQAQFFRRESLVFRTALSRLSHHRPLRDAYRDAERRTLTHLVTVFERLAEAGLVPPTEPAARAEAFMIASQGINNPRALAPPADHVRSSLARGLSGILAHDGGAHD